MPIKFSKPTEYVCWDTLNEWPTNDTVLIGMRASSNVNDSHLKEWVRFFSLRLCINFWNHDTIHTLSLRRDIKALAGLARAGGVKDQRAASDPPGSALV